MNRLPTLGLLVGCLALVSRGDPVVHSSAALAQEKGQAEVAAGEVTAGPDSGDETGGAVSDPHESPADDDSEEDEPSTGDEGGSGDEDADDGDEAASQPPAQASGNPTRGVEAL